MSTSILARATALAAILVIPAVSACSELPSDRLARINDPYTTSDASHGVNAQPLTNEPNWQSFRYQTTP